ncbi:LADA_0A01244g1_1 [Lachancea dasiensis]|uniref:LADA_0A01244g1_1 n=1 Tax=Lachancea dasiensis TaxID=1072105 RepID=A0A1G4ILV0_9SACH|nr:LADA_0A01244g1_1 [Lachancea dasiensis]
MSNLTPLFHKYVNVFLEDPEVERLADSQEFRSPGKKYIIEDTFIKECLELKRHALELQKVIESIKVSYTSEVELTDREKDDFDTEVRLLVQQYFDKLKFLEQYEQKRQSVVATKYLIDAQEGDLLSIFRHKDENLSSFHVTNIQHRSGVLQSLGLILSSIFSEISLMQQQRLTRQRELESIDFNAQLYVPMATVVGSVHQAPAIETTEEEVHQYQETLGKLSQEQLQMLETEHNELLNLKTQELQKVENLGKTMVQIASLQNEITTHLQAQTQSIFGLMDNHDNVELNIQQGNRQLTKAQRRGGKSARLIVYLSVLFGMLILVLDFIN